MICQRCQQSIRAGARFCDNCGLSVGTIVAEDQSPKPSVETPSDPLIGHVIDSKYQIVEQLGRGGMGIVYRAERVLVGDEVALKILHREFVAEGETVERFRREARAAAKLRPPNVVTIYDYGEAGGAEAPAYIVMELLKGKSLRDLLRREGNLKPERAIQLMRGICAGIGLAHRRHIVHRDIKPDNIILLPPDEEEGREHETVKVVDFGIAKLRDAATGSTLTRKGFQPGTVFYMSPEQCRGDELDARSDVYSLGALLYEMLAGAPPFIAESHTGVMAKHLFDPPPPLPEDLHIPAELEAVVMRALAKEPEARPEDAIALGRELQAVEQQVVKQLPAEKEARSPAAGKRVLEEGRVEEQSRDTSETLSNATGRPQRPPDTEVQRKAETETETRQKPLAGPAPKSRSGSTAADSAADDDAGRVKVAKTRGMSKVWITLGGLIAVGIVAMVSFSLLNRNRSTKTGDGSGDRGNTSGGVITTSTPPAAGTPDYKPLGNPLKTARPVFKVALSPDGKALSSTGSSASPPANSPSKILNLDGSSLAFSPDGKSLAVGQESGSISLKDPTDLSQKSEWQAGKDYVFIVAFTPDSQRLISASADKTVRVWNVSSGQQEQQTQIGKDELIITIDPNQKRAAIAYKPGGQVRIRSINDPAAMSAFDNRKADVTCGAFSPNGETLALGTSDGKVQLWSIPDGTFIREYQGQTRGEVGSVAFAPNGQYLAIGWNNGDIELRRTSDGGSVQTLKGHTRVVRTLSFSRDGRTLASGAEDKTIR